MQLKTQSSNDALEIRNAGIAFDVYAKGAKRLGDLALTRSGLIWSNGNVQRAGGVTVKWDDFINWMQAQAPMKAETKKPQAKPRATATNGKRVAAPAKKIGANPAASASKAARKTAH